MLQAFLKKISLGTLILTTFFLASCQKELNSDELFLGNNTDLTTRVNAAVSGFVTDENNQAVNGATVKFGTATVMTDEYGYFRFSLNNVIKNAAMVSVTYPGYFKGIKTFIAEEGKSAFFRIQLLPKTTAGSFNATSGGVVSLPNGLSINFPSNVITDYTSSNSSPYSGTVHVSVHWLNPTAPNLAQIMPGDLRGIDSEGAMKVLQTYGMAAVELTGDAGQVLNITAGQSATVNFPLPAAIAATAPASIPLWYFDENLGLWKQEGSATKTGNSYVGTVSHFSFWNCDVPNNYVQFNCTVVDGDGAPVAFAWVKISEVSNPYNAGFGLTDSSGYVHGAVPNNSSLKLEIYTDFSCGTPVYTQTFSTTNTNISLGTITIPIGSVNLANVTGTVTDCSNAPVTNGYVMMLKNGSYYRYGLDNAGAFDFSTIICNGSEAVSFISEDRNSMQQSTPLNYTLNNGNNAVGNLQACGVTTQQFIDYSVNGVSASMTAPADSLMMYVNPQVTPNQIVITGMSLNSGSGGSTGTQYVSFSFDATGIAVGSSQTMAQFFCTNITDSTSITTPIMVNITEYGAIGAYISGNFSGVFTGAAPANTPYTITGSFRVRRTQ